MKKGFTLVKRFQLLFKMTILSPRERVRERGRNFGFTLAEVLITLGIIGVVAALTMPTLIANYQKRILVTQLKKEVNVIQNSFQQIIANEGVSNICETSIADENCTPDSPSINVDAYKKYFGLEAAPASSNSAKVLGEGGIILQSKNGAIFAFDGFDILIDINGDKGPNKGGRDRFYVNLQQSEFSKEEAENCEGFANYDYSDLQEGEEVMLWAFGGLTCYSKIVRDGWQMNY